MRIDSGFLSSRVMKFPYQLLFFSLTLESPSPFPFPPSPNTFKKRLLICFLGLFPGTMFVKESLCSLQCYSFIANSVFFLLLLGVPLPNKEGECCRQTEIQEPSLTITDIFPFRKVMQRSFFQVTSKVTLSFSCLHGFLVYPAAKN